MSGPKAGSSSAQNAGPGRGDKGGSASSKSGPGGHPPSPAPPKSGKGK